MRTFSAIKGTRTRAGKQSRESGTSPLFFRMMWVFLSKIERLP